MKKMFICLLSVFVLNTSSVLAHHETALTIIASESKEFSKNIEINIESIDAVDGVCPVIVNRFEYLPTLNTILIEATKEMPCLNEQFGKVKGQFFWTTPSTITTKSNAINILLNGKMTASLILENNRLKSIPVTNLN